MHNTRQSFAERRLRMIEAKTVTRRTRSSGSPTPGPTVRSSSDRQALAVMDQWMANIHAHPALGVAADKPPLAVDRCFATEGDQIAAGPRVWDGVLDNRPAGACTQQFPIHATSRVIAGGPFDEDVFKCQLSRSPRRSRAAATGRGDPDAVDCSRLEQIFPTGVCDYSKPPVGLPRS